jgi:hypothetical protein
MAEPSIHHRRRWYYVLWTGLLLLSCLGLFLWELPVATELASMEMLLKVDGVPPGTRLEAWAGPWSSWPGAAWTGAGAFGDLIVPPGGRLKLPRLRVPIARRRWKLGYIPRGTWDLVMLKVSPPSGPPRYFPLPLSQDIRIGLLRPKYKLTVDIYISWDNLQVDAKAPNRVP